MRAAFREGRGLGERDRRSGRRDPAALGTELLLALCAPGRGLVPRSDPGDVALSLSPVAHRVDFRALAERHKVQGPLARAVERRAAGEPAIAALFPGPERERLRLGAAATRSFRALLVHEWGRVEEGFRKEGLRALVIKGPALSLQLYDDPLEREFRDLDLLLRAPDLQVAARILSSMGYDAADEDLPGLPEKRRAWASSASHHLVMKKAGRPFFFELHGVAEDSMGLELPGAGDAFRRAVILERDGIRYPTLGAEDQALAAFLHAARHQWCALQWLLDSAVILVGGSLRIPATTPPPPGGVDIQLASAAFALIAERRFEGEWRSRVGPLPARELGRARRLAELAEPSASGSGHQGGMYRAAWRALAFRTRLSGAARPALAALLELAKPSAQDLQAFGKADLPLGFFYAARPFLLAARVARSWIEGR